MNITITVTVTSEGFFTNAQHGADFVCTVAQPTLELSLASAMPDIRKMAEKAEKALAREINELECMDEEAAAEERKEELMAKLWTHEFWHGPAIDSQEDIQEYMSGAGRKPWQSDYAPVVLALIFALISIASFSQV